MLDLHKEVPIFRHAESVEQVLCLAVLIANKALPYNAGIGDATKFYEDLGRDGCCNCPYEQGCLACIINGG